jgi:hypothetical protein
VRVPEVFEVLGDLEAAVVAFCDAFVVSSSAASSFILGTPASGEISKEPALRYGWNFEPVRTAHTFVRLGNFFVVDQLRTLARLMTMSPPAVYGPFVVTRSLLDAAGVAYWLAEPGIGADRRIQRRLVVDLFDASEQRIPDRKELAVKAAEVKAIPARIEAFCVHHGWKFRAGPVLVGSEQRPSRPKLIGAAVDPDASALATGLGATLWWFLSGHTHGGSDALLSVVEPAAGADPAAPNAVVVVDGVKLVWMVVAASRAARRLTERRAALFGDMAPDVESAGKDLDGQLLRYLEAAQSGRLPAGYTA